MKEILTIELHQDTNLKELCASQQDIHREHGTSAPTVDCRCEGSRWEAWSADR